MLLSVTPHKRQFILFDRSLGDLDIQSVDGGGWRLAVLWTDVMRNPVSGDRPGLARHIIVKQGTLKTFCHDVQLAPYLIPANTPLSQFREAMVVSHNPFSKSVFGRWVIIPLVDSTYTTTVQSGLPARMENGRSDRVWLQHHGWYASPLLITDDLASFGVWDRPNNTGVFGGANVCANQAASSLLWGSNPCHFDQTLVKGIFLR